MVPFTHADQLAVLGADAQDHQIHGALATLSADQAAALLLHHQQGFTRREIAEMTGVSEEAVKSRLDRGRANFVAAYRRLERGLAR
jgi:RNA polymerase sigma factor (sigma-70 family)